MATAIAMAMAINMAPRPKSQENGWELNQPLVVYLDGKRPPGSFIWAETAPPIWGRSGVDLIVFGPPWGLFDCSRGSRPLGRQAHHNLRGIHGSRSREFSMARFFCLQKESPCVRIHGGNRSRKSFGVHFVAVLLLVKSERPFYLLGPPTHRLERIGACLSLGGVGWGRVGLPGLPGGRKKKHFVIFDLA